MKKEISIKAKTLDEAIAKAAETLGVPAEKLTIKEIAKAKKGFFGIGAADAEIIASYESVEEKSTCDNVAASEKNVCPLSPAGKSALDFITGIIADMGLKANAEAVSSENGETVINVTGDGAGILIGHHGETLDALQYLATLAANHREKGEKREYTRISLDVEGYRAKREEILRALARKQAARVLKYKKSVMLEPMNPYERRIIHSEIQNIEGVSTNSIGSESNRKIVIYLDCGKKNVED